MEEYETVIFADQNPLPIQREYPCIGYRETSQDQKSEWIFLDHGDKNINKNVFVKSENAA